MRRPLWLGLLGVLACPAQALFSQSDLTFVVPASPFPWTIAMLLLAAFLAVSGCLAYLVRFLMGEKTLRLPFEKKRVLEKSYADKLRLEFQKKTDTLNQQLLEVRRRFALVFMKVRNLATTLDPDKLFKSIMEMLASEVGASRFILFLYDREKKELYPFRWEGFPDDIKQQIVIPVAHEHFLTYAFHKQQMVYKLAAIDDPETRGLVGREPLPETMLAIPIAVPGEAFGVIHIESFKDNRTEVDDTDLRFFSSLISFMGLAISNADIFLQTRDELTSSRQLSEKEMAEKKQIKEIFSRYTSAELVETIMSNPGSINLGGTRKEATILFSDIAGFTNFSSQLTPEQVVNTMNEYLSAMTEVVLENQGEIDKFIGDAVMARFGVLAQLKNPGLSAVKAALEMLKALRTLQAKWVQENRQTFNIRIGIASGPLLAGNIGSERRQEFTVMGTTVNLASRLEALNKELKTTILIDEKTYYQVYQQVRAIPRDDTAIRGLEGKMTVYEVVDFLPESGVVKKT